MNPTPEFEYGKWFPAAPYATLARPAAIPDHRSFAQWQHLVRFWNYKAFGARISWSIFADIRPVSGRRAVVRRVTWTVVPSPLVPEGQNKVVIEDADLVPEEVDAHMESLIDIPIALFPRRPHWGLDGESSGIEKPLMFYLDWWCDGPKEWSDFTSRVRAFREWLDLRYEGQAA